MSMQINGLLPLNFDVGAGNRAVVFLIGGPFKNYAASQARHYAKGINLLETKVKGAAIHFPIVDFNVPKDDENFTKFLKAVVALMFQDGIAWIGCAGAIGRTGMVMSVLAKIAGEDDPVAYVRKNYLGHAVETPEQHAFVAAFNVTEMQEHIKATYGSLPVTAPTTVDLTDAPAPIGILEAVEALREEVIGLARKVNQMTEEREAAEQGSEAVAEGERIVVQEPGTDMLKDFPNNVFGRLRLAANVLFSRS